MKITIRNMDEGKPRFGDDNVVWFTKPGSPDKLYCKLPDADAKELSQCTSYNVFSVVGSDLLTFMDDTLIVLVDAIEVTARAV